MSHIIYLWGDSIGRGVIYDTERKRYRIARQSSLRLLSEAGLTVECHARMGATVIDAYKDFCRTQTVCGGTALLEFGGNDCDLDWQAVADAPECFHDACVPLPVFREMLRTFLRDARGRGLQPVLVTPPPLLSQRYFAWVTRKNDKDAIMRYLGDVEHIYRWQERYAQAIRETAYQEQCVLADAREAFLSQRDFPNFICEDGIHPNEEGQVLLSRALRYCLSEQIALRPGA